MAKGEWQMLRSQRNASEEGTGTTVEQFLNNTQNQHWSSTVSWCHRRSWSLLSSLSFCKWITATIPLLDTATVQTLIWLLSKTVILLCRYACTCDNRSSRFSQKDLFESSDSFPLFHCWPKSLHTVYRLHSLEKGKTILYLMSLDHKSYIRQFRE